jgi:short-subunit dehydrogenase
MIEKKKVSVITGAASGIGFALAEACVNRHMHVVMVDQAAAALREKSQLLRKTAQSEIIEEVCDVRNFKEVQRVAERTLQRFGRTDLLINNAGISGEFAPIWEIPLDKIDDVMQVNLHGVLHGIYAFLPYLFKQNHRSHIVNMASFYGLCSGSLLASYAMSKHAILALTESLYFDLTRLNKPVDVSIVCPSFAQTQLLTNSTPQRASKLHEMMNSLVDRGRPAADIAEHILQEIEKQQFYILPDKEVKEYCEQRTKAIVEQRMPYQHSLEKIVSLLSERAMSLRS